MSAAKPFQSVWADIGEAETELLIAVLRSAAAAHARLVKDREAGRPAHPYAEHMAMDVESRLRALLGYSPHVAENFVSPDWRKRRAIAESDVVRPNG